MLSCTVRENRGWVSQYMRVQSSYENNGLDGINRACQSRFLPDPSLFLTNDATNTEVLAREPNWGVYQVYRRWHVSIHETCHWVLRKPW
jgi:hypothetical protein